jgi:hypothetical protein
MKYLEVLKYLYDKRPKSVHYAELTSVIYSSDVISKYSHHRNKRTIIDGMTCRYLGKLARKDLIQAQYNCIEKTNISYFVGYYLRPNGIKLLKDKKII